MLGISAVLTLVAVICFMLAAFNVGVNPRISVGWLGVFLWALNAVIGSFRTP